MFEAAEYRNELSADTAETAAGIASADVFSLARGLRKLELDELGELAQRQLNNAKDRFKGARRKATEAYDNEALELSDRVLAMQYRVLAMQYRSYGHNIVDNRQSRGRISSLQRVHG